MGYVVSISSLASFDRAAAYILASLIPHFRRFMEAVDEYVEGMSKAMSERIGKKAERHRRKSGT